jgi:hypothetical protein
MRTSRTIAGTWVSRTKWGRDATAVRLRDWGKISDVVWRCGGEEKTCYSDEMRMLTPIPASKEMNCRLVRAFMHVLPKVLKPIHRLIWLSV